MEFTGERFIPGKCDIALELEHMNRYRFARSLVEGRRVLDIACGSGYGSAMLAERAASVAGMDISEEAVRYCQETYAKENLSFAVGNVAEIPLADASVDAVVSFETLEHVDLADQLRFFREVKRVLAPGGLLVISTPNKEVYDERGDNEFHKHELSAEEFSAFLEGSFGNVRLCGQITEVCNLISGGAADAAAWHGALDVSQAEYLIALASDAPLPETLPSVMPREDGRLRALTDWAVGNDARVHELSAWGKGLDEEVAQRGETIADLNRQVETLSSWGRKLDGDVARQGEVISGLNARVEELSAWGKGLDEEVAKRGEAITGLNARVEELSAWGKGLDEEVARRDEAISQRDAELAQRSEELAALAKESAYHKGHVEALERVVDERNGSIASLEAQRASLQARVSDLSEKEQRLFLIENSKAWKFARGLQKISGALLPMGSRRRLVVRYTFRFLRHPVAMVRRLRADRGRLSNFRGRLVHGDSSFAAATAEPPVQRGPIRAEAVQPAKALEEYAPLSFPAWPQPQVSIVIPVYNQFEYTYECLRSILANTPDVSYEVIIADDCSTDNTARITELVGNIRVVRTETNQRFLRNCNNAAKHARGQYIFFLNNDTQVQPDWLGSLVRLMEEDATIGMCGSKLVYPDGLLQEAGGILWRDGSAWNYGNRQDPEASEYNYVKDVDYISGAAVMIRAGLWREIGGFDDAFAPAYYEDTDLAFEVRRHGKRVVYQPLSVVVHYEGVSNGTSTASGLKAYQIENQRKFREKWKAVLEKEHFENGVNVFQARDRSRRRRAILVVDHYVPMFDKDAGSRCVFQYLTLYVRQGLNVKFIGDNFARFEPYTRILQQMGIEVLYGNEYALHWQNWLEDNGRYFDFAMLNRPHISVRYIGKLRKCSQAKIYYFGHDLHFLRERRRYEATGDAEALALSKDWYGKEYDLMRKADEAWYPSQVEADEMHSRDASLRVRAIPLFLFDGSDPVPYRAEERRDLIFVGGFNHTPNVDAVKWFHDEIWPTVSARNSEVRIHIIGSHPPKEIEELNSERFIVTGFLSDEELAGFYHSCRMVIVPLRYGAGIKGKVVEAMVHRVPILTTSIGAEGIDCKGGSLATHDDAASFAETLLRLYDDPAALNGMSSEYERFIREVYSFEHAAETLSEEFDGWRGADEA